MRALAEVRVKGGDNEPLTPQLERPGYGFDTPCAINGRCLWGVEEDGHEACREPEDENTYLPCAGGWWFVCTGSAWEGAYTLHPADAILLAARALEAKTDG